MKDQNQDRLEDWLDKALRQYGNVQPRIGLEGRVAATLEVARRRSATRKRWGLCVGTAAAVCVISTFIWKDSNSPQPVGNTVHNFSTQLPKDATPKIPGVHKTKKSGISNAANNTRRNSRNPGIRTAASPRLSEFPAVRPLSQQEQLLRAYVNQFPKQAALIALEQAQREKELQALYTENSTDSEQER
jgi:hypothetical protein